jgi:hypothetical protein
VTANSNNVTGVQHFYDGNNAINQTLSSAPYSYAWSQSLWGSHSVFARVYYNNGSSQDSAVATVNFITVPAVLAAAFEGSGKIVLNFGKLVADRNYELQSTTNLTSNVWASEINFVPVTSMIAITNQVNGAAQKFYRVVGN